ncbi:MAG: hypothetical protein ABW090_11865 [Sedimenticola sp.]
MMHISTGEFWFFLALAVAASGAGFWFAFRNLVRARIIEDTPTARVRSAQQGYVELNGTALLMDGEPIRAPLTGIECCWYRYKIEKRGDKNWHRVESDTSDSLFLIQDQTGDCIVDPEGAEVTPSDRSVWYGRERQPVNRNPDRNPVMQQPIFRLAKFLNTDLNGGFGGHYRYTEERIYSGDLLYAIGLFKTLDDMDHARSRKELAMELLREWKRDQAGMLERFDSNGDGQIDMQEWEKVRRSAATEAGKAYTEQMANQVLHTLGNTGSRRHPFLISTLPQFNLVRRYRLYAGGSIAAFFIGGGIAAWLLSTYF